MAMNQPPPPPDMPEIMRISVTEISGTKPVHWLFEETLRRSDVSPQQGRIFISQAARDFLTPAEHKKYRVLRGDTSRNKEEEEIRVTLVEPDGTKSEIDFKIWSSLGTAGQSLVDEGQGEGLPVLTGSNWNSLVRKYNMEVGTTLQFWCFRNANTNELCFAMNREGF